MAWVAVTKTGIETMFRNCPMRYRGFWIDEQELKLFNECFKYKHEIDEDCSIELPSGTIERLINKKLTWEDDPVEI